MSESNTITKTIKVRLINTHDTSTNWAQVASTFTPEAGEFIIYDIDSSAGQYAPRAKIGDGSTTLDKLPFSTAPVWIGTKAAYSSEQGNLPIGTIVYITDDGDAGEYTDQSENTILEDLPVASVEYRGRIAVVSIGGNDQPFMCLYRGGQYSWYPIPVWGESTGGDNAGSATTTAKLGTAKLGSMILGQE